MPKLIVNPGTPNAWEIQLQEGTASLGRNAANDVQIDDPTVSGSHCQISVSGDTVSVKDLGSTNGTYLNGTQIQEGALEMGQSLHLGSVEMALFTELPPPAAAPRPTRRITLHVSGHTATPPPPPPMIAQPAAEGSFETEPVMHQLSSGPRFCKFHPKSPARYLCNKCNRTFCELCITGRSVGGVIKKTCRTCAVELVPLQVAPSRIQQRGFFASLPGSFIYPFKGFGLLVIIFATLAFAAGNYFVNPLLRIAIYGLVFLFMQNIIHTTTSDEKEPLGFPDMDGLFGAAFQLGGTIIASFGLAIGLIVAKVFEVEIPTSAIIAAVIFGCLYFPMAFLAVAMKDTIAAANPLIVIPAIIKVPLHYLVATLLLMSVFGVRQLGDIVSGAASDITFETRDRTVLFMSLGGQAMWALISIYLLTVSMRILGLFYNANKDKLAWY